MLNIHLYLNNRKSKILEISPRYINSTSTKEIIVWTLVIEWDQVIIENTLLAAIILGSIYIEQWAHDRSHLKEEKRTKKRILLFIADDLQKRLDFIKETYQYNDYKPFFTDMWNAVILTGKHCSHLNCFKTFSVRIPGWSTIIAK